MHQIQIKVIEAGGKTEFNGFFGVWSGVGSAKRGQIIRVKTLNTNGEAIDSCHPVATKFLSFGCARINLQSDLRPALDTDFFPNVIQQLLICTRAEQTGCASTNKNRMKPTEVRQLE